MQNGGGSVVHLIYVFLFCPCLSKDLAKYGLAIKSVQRRDQVLDQQTVKHIQIANENYIHVLQPIDLQLLMLLYPTLFFRESRQVERVCVYI